MKTVHLALPGLTNAKSKHQIQIAEFEMSAMSEFVGDKD